MKVLVTGGAGFIGSNLALHLQDRHEVTVLDDFSSGTSANLRGFGGEIIDADISGVRIDADVIFHQAAITDTTRSDAAVMEVNAHAFRRLLDAAVARNADVIYASSASVYGSGPVPMREDQQPDPKNAYAESKLLMESFGSAAAGAAGAAGIKVTGLRYFNVYGPREQHKQAAASMIYQLYLQLKAGRNPRVFKHGEQCRDFVHVGDIVKANVLAMKAKKGGIFNVGSGTATSFNDVIALLRKALNIDRKTEYFDNPYGFYQEATCADVSMAKRVLGYSPSMPIEKGIAHYVNSLGMVS